MSIEYFNQRVAEVTANHNKVISRKNTPKFSINGIFNRYEYPALMREDIPLNWRFDFSYDRNPMFLERIRVNAIMNAGAIYLNGKYILVARVEGNDRKSYFAIAESDNGVDGFKFRDKPIVLPKVEEIDTNVYDMRLTQHEDGWLHIAHGVRNHATGLRYVLYCFMTALDDPTNVIHSPGGYFLAPKGSERDGDVSGCVFSNGAIADEEGRLFVYYASADTRLQVISTTVEKMVDYCKNTPEDGLTTHTSVEAICNLIDANEGYYTKG